jgi:hypothetical protein
VFEECAFSELRHVPDHHRILRVFRFGRFGEIKAASFNGHIIHDDHLVMLDREITVSTQRMPCCSLCRFMAAMLARPVLPLFINYDFHINSPFLAATSAFIISSGAVKE